MFNRIFLLAAGLALAAGVTITAAAQPQTEAANAAVAYIESLQNEDGGFPAPPFGEESAPDLTLDAIFALAAAGQEPRTIAEQGTLPVEYLATQAEEYATDPGSAAKLTLGLLVMQFPPDFFGGLDLRAQYRLGPKAAVSLVVRQRVNSITAWDEGLLVGGASVGIALGVQFDD